MSRQFIHTSIRYLKHTVKEVMHKFGFDIVKYRIYNKFKENEFPSDIEKEIIPTLIKIQPYTMATIERSYPLCKAVEYIVKNNIPGDIAECGVWKGGSMMAVADTLLRLKDTTRHLYLYDTYEGMTEPTEFDINHKGEKAIEIWEDRKTYSGTSDWVNASLDSVKKAMKLIGYPEDKIHYVKGMVEDTLPVDAPQKLALLRLDTDWYESTLHELIHMYPRLSEGGVLILDDYGYWQGSKKAVDEYINDNNLPIFLNRMDFMGRIAIKYSESKLKN